jgi:hypothetical protein
VVWQEIPEVEVPKVEATRPVLSPSDSETISPTRRADVASTSASPSAEGSPTAAQPFARNVPSPIAVPPAAPAGGDGSSRRIFVRNNGREAGGVTFGSEVDIGRYLGRFGTIVDLYTIKTAPPPHQRAPALLFVTYSTLEGAQAAVSASHASVGPISVTFARKKEATAPGGVVASSSSLAASTATAGSTSAPTTGGSTLTSATGAGAAPSRTSQPAEVRTQRSAAAPTAASLPAEFRAQLLALITEDGVIPLSQLLSRHRSRFGDVASPWARRASNAGTRAAAAARARTFSLT